MACWIVRRGTVGGPRLVRTVLDPGGFLWERGPKLSTPTASYSKGQSVSSMASIIPR